jgi:hypothetical protein
MTDTYTSNIVLTKPGRGDPWWEHLNTNFDTIDTNIGGLNNNIDDLPDIEVHNDTFNSTTGVAVSLTKTVDAVNEYSVKITPDSRAGAIGDIWVVKGTSSFTVYCSDANTTDTFEAIVFFKGDVSSYGGSIYRRYYVSPDTSITDHSIVGTNGSLAYILDEMSGTNGVIEFPGNRIYSIVAGTVTIPDGITLHFQPGAYLDLQEDITFNSPNSIIAKKTQKIFSLNGGTIIFTNGGTIPGGWFGMVGDDATENEDYFSDWVDIVYNNNAHGFLAKGIYQISTGKTITGNDAAETGLYFGMTGEVGGATETDGVVIKWVGTDDSANTMFKMEGIFRAEFKNIVFNGDNKVGKCFYVTYSGSTPQYAASRYKFDGLILFGAKGGAYGDTPAGWLDIPGNAAFYLGGNQNCNRFTFINCLFYHGTSGFHMNNGNALTTTFIGCGFARSVNGIYCQVGGSFSLQQCEFSANYNADINLSIHSSISIENCWSEQSNMFLTTDGRGQTSPVVIKGCNISSFPYSFYTLGFGDAPDNDDTQYVSIRWNRSNAALVLIGTRLSDPFLSGLIPRVWSESTSNDNIINIGSIISTNESGGPLFTKNIVYTGTEAETSGDGYTPKSRGGVVDLGEISSGFILNARNGGSQHIILATATVNMYSISGGHAGDVLRLYVEQDDTGGRTMYFPAALKLVGGAYVPTATANAVDALTIEYDGTYWWETSRSLDIK